jgi:hypothetical protein
MALIARKEDIDVDFSRYMPIRELDKAALLQAREIFEDYRKRGVIIKGGFEDYSWTLFDEVKKVGVTLLSFEGGAEKQAMTWIGCTYHRYVKYIKAYIMLNLGEISLFTIQDLIRVFKRLAFSTCSEAVRMTEYATHIIALLQLIPGGNEQRDAVIEELEEKTVLRRNRKGKKQRCLADFKSYLRFHEILSGFWIDAGERSKLFYFPLYFWWNLTAILPLRPLEFLLIPRNCLQTNDGKHTLTIRRTKLKGGNEKISYRIADDYELKQYAINGDLANELRQYIEMTASERRVKLDTLLAQEPHCAYLGTTPMYSSHYYTYAYLKTCLRYFYDEVIDTGCHDIARIHLGDTRHLAMTNLILSGGSPVICRELAGHAHIDVSAHYYSNISNLVECATLERYRKSKKIEAIVYGGSKYHLTVPADARRVSEGHCVSEKFRDGSIDDCLKVTNYNGNIGDCRFCGYYLPDNPGVMTKFHDVNEAKQRLDADSRYLIRMIELVRKGLGYTEDIGSALLRLQRSGDHFSKCLWEKYTTEGKP